MSERRGITIPPAAIRQGDDVYVATGRDGPDNGLRGVVVSLSPDMIGLRLSAGVRIETVDRRHVRKVRRFS